MKKIIKYFSFLFLVIGFVLPANAQWKTEIFPLKAGWNAIYSHVDASHTTIEQLTQNNGIVEVWMWKPKLSTLQYIQKPDMPLDNLSRWSNWSSSDPGSSSLQKITGNNAYLIKAIQPLNWVIKGKPVPPRYQWTSTGLNFIGFSTSFSAPPIFSNFLNPVNGFGAGAQIFSYDGGAITDPTPSQVFALNTSNVKRGQAYWVRAQGYNRYYGPFELELQDFSGVHFGDSISSYKVVLKNTTKQDLVVNMQFMDSETAPVQDGIPTVKGKPPIILRGDFQTDSLTFNHSSIGTSPKSWTLKPMGETGSSVEILLGVHWSQLNGNAGDFFAGLLYFSDNSNHLQTILPVSVTKPNTTGLWVGNTSVNEVRHGMNTFKESFVKGNAKTSVNGTQDSPVSVSWLKKQAIDINSSEYQPDEDYYQSDLGYHRIIKKEYVNVIQGDKLWFPTADEKGNFLTDPASYWLARPYHEAFIKGWYWEAGVVVANGHKENIEMTFIKATAPTVPTGYTLFKDTHEGSNAAPWWYLEKEESYSGKAVGDAIAPPSVDENGNSLDAASTYWKPTGNDLNVVENGFTSKIEGDFTVKWRKESAEVREEKKIQKTVFSGQKIIASDIYSDDMPASDWYIHKAPSKPKIIWEGTLSTGASGSYQVAKTNNNWGKVAKPMKLRLIVHNDNESPPNANMMQRVYLGIDSKNSSLSVTTLPSLLPDGTPEVRRVSSVHLPWSKTNQPWKFNGSFAKGNTLSTSVIVEHNDLAANPFIHNYHPDHDNLDPRFEKKLDQGNESYQIKRDITIKLSGSQSGFNGLAQGGKVIRGEYEEIITLSGKSKISGNGNETRQYGMRGTVDFRRISSVSNLRTN